jgi:hypothetical protein
MKNTTYRYILIYFSLVFAREIEDTRTAAGGVKKALHLFSELILRFLRGFSTNSVQKPAQ